MRKFVFLQIIATFGVAAISFFFGGESAACSALFAGLACTVPNALFALNMGVLVKLSPSSSAIFFLIGEFIKLIASALLLVLLVVFYKDLVWPAMIASIVVVLNCSFLGLLTRE